MKRILSLLLSFSMIFCLVACNIDSQDKDVTTDESSDETMGVLIEELIADLENGAKAQQNIGKKTTVFGKILEIGATHCVVELLNRKAVGTMISVYFEVYVYMDTDTLAKLYVDDYIAVTGKISSVMPFTSFANTYTITSSRIEDVAVMDKIFLGYIKDIEDGNDWPEYDNFEVCDRIYGYLSFRGDAFCMKDDEQLKNYLIGKWEFYDYFYTIETSLHSYHVYTFEFKSDGTYFLEETDYRETEGKWSVSEGKLVSFMGFNPRNVYVLSDNAFFCDGSLLMRITKEG